MVNPQNGVIAHRGNMSEFPENTLPSFESAISCGAEWIELDIQKTSDGLLVVTHDTSAFRVTGTEAVITQTPFSTLEKLNFGNYFNDGRFYKLPLLDDIFKLIKGKTIKVSLQPKNNGLVREAIQLAEKNRVLRQVGFNDINCEYLIEVKLIHPEIPVFWDRLTDTDTETEIQIAKNYGFETLMYLKEAVTKEKIASVKREGIAVGVCVVNDEADMRKLMDWGIEIFYTDYPKRLIGLKEQHDG